MPDYEELILERQDLIEIYEDDPDMMSACDTCYLYNRGIPCGVKPGVCKREV